MAEDEIMPEPCYYFGENGRCMMMIKKKVKGAEELTQYCVLANREGRGTGCHRTKEQIETELIEAKNW